MSRKDRHWRFHTNTIPDDVADLENLENLDLVDLENREDLENPEDLDLEDLAGPLNMDSIVHTRETTV
jgi:hypothetical protein